MNALHLADSPDSIAHLRTRIANHGVCLMALLERKLRDVRLGNWSVQLVAQDVPSTGSGIRARQSLVLVPESPSGRAFVIGAVCTVSQTVQLRSFDEMADIHKARMGVPCAFTRADHIAFSTDLAVAFAAARIKLDVQRYSSTPPPPMAVPAQRSVGLAPIAAAIVAVIALSVVWLEYVTPLVR